jgi:glycolate oxidase
VYRCRHCGKEIRKGERPDYSATKGLVHYECDVKYYKSQVPASMANQVVPQLSWLGELTRIVGLENVKTTYLDRAYYLQDHSTDFIDLDHGHAPDVVALPRTEEEVSNIVKLAAREKIPITPRGAGTGFVGGAVALKGGILLDLTQMNKIINIDEHNYHVSAEAGTNLLAIEDELNKKGLTLGFDPGSGPVVSIGGSVSTDQIGGDGWYSNLGSMRQRVLTLRAVLPDGTVVSTGRPLDRATSTVNLAHLFIAAEGTFGIVTQVTLKVFPVPEAKETRLVVFDDFKQASNASMAMAKLGLWPSIHHCIDVVKIEQATSKFEVTSFGTLILGFSGPKEVVAAQSGRALSICALNGGVDAGKQAVADFWERHHEAFPVELPGNQVYGMESVTLPLDKILPVYYEWRSIAIKHGMKWYGGGFNTNPAQLWVMYAFENTEVGLSTKAVATDEMLKFGAEAGGTVSSVHGIGYLKRKYYPLEFDDENLLALMRKVKKTLDPDNIMNPGKVVYD